jgi:hypothetical protein
MKVKARDTLGDSMLAYSDRRLKRKVRACRHSFSNPCSASPDRDSAALFRTLAKIAAGRGDLAATYCAGKPGWRGRGQACPLRTSGKRRTR